VRKIKWIGDLGVLRREMTVERVLVRSGFGGGIVVFDEQSHPDGH
jgi:hypothetical protein